MAESQIFLLGLEPPPPLLMAGICSGRPGYQHHARFLRWPELFVIESGVLYIEADGQQQMAKAGSVVFNPPGVQQRGYSPSPAGVRFVWLHFQTEIVKSESEIHSFHYLTELLNNNSPLARGSIDMLPIPAFFQPASFGLIRNLAYLLAENRAAFCSEYSGLLVSLLSRLSADYLDESRQTARTQQERAVASAKSWLDQHISQSVTARDLASAVKLNPDHLNRLFRQHVGMTLSAFIISRRMDKAKQLLVAGKSVKETAYLTGFNDFRYFSRCFRKHVGLCPSAYLNHAGDFYQND